MRTASHLVRYQFQPGVSGNPTGRPKNPISRKEILGLKEDILSALKAALEEPEQRIEALQIATMYLWGKPAEFQLTEEAEELDAALAAVKTMSVEELKALAVKDR